MSKTVTYTIESILNGISPIEFFGAKEQYAQSVGIDPNLPVTDAKRKPSGIIRPSAFANFAALPTTTPLAIITAPTTTKIYVAYTNGKLFQYNSDFTGETQVADISATLSGAFYQNDYIYLVTATDMSRYGALSGSPTLTNGVWTGATLGSLTALTNNTYPSLLGSGNYPQHWAFNHQEGSNKSYILDYKSGKGIVHFVKTDSSGVNSGSTYEALDLPLGYYPMGGCAFGKDIAIVATQITDSTVKQGKSMLFLWDTIADSFYAAIPVPGIVTACENIDGTLYVFSGSISGLGNHHLSYYAGENTVLPVLSLPEGFPPVQGAVAQLGHSLCWGSFLSNPGNYAVVHSWGSRDGVLPKAFHTIAVSNITHTATAGMITALANCVLSSFNGLVIGSFNATAVQSYLEKLSTTYGTSVFRTTPILVGTRFQVREVKFRLAQPLAANMTVTPKVYTDNDTEYDGRVVNTTNYTAGEKRIKDSSITAEGDNSFYLELTISGTVLCAIVLPITITVELLEE